VSSAVMTVRKRDCLFHQDRTYCCIGMSKCGLVRYTVLSRKRSVVQNVQKRYLEDSVRTAAVYLANEYREGPFSRVLAKEPICSRSFL
jgi:hypothetical protein